MTRRVFCKTYPNSDWRGMMFASRKPAAAARRIGSLPALQTALLLRRLRRDRSGNVAMLFGLLLIPLVAMIGLAVDFGRVYSVTSHTQAALDSAAFAAGRIARLDKVDTVNKASAAADGLLQPGQADGCRDLDAAVHPQRREHAVHRYRHLMGEDAVPERPLLARSQGWLRKERRLPAQATASDASWSPPPPRRRCARAMPAPAAAAAAATSRFP